MSSDIDHLEDHVLWFSAVLALRSGSAPDANETVTRIVQVRAEIARRSASEPRLIATTLVTALGLTETEAHVVWVLATYALCCHEPPTLDAIRSIVYGGGARRDALTELGPQGT